MEIIGAIIGVLYIVLEYRASVWLWPVGVVMPIIYIYIYHQAGIYADMGINVYFLLAAVYGWIVWSRNKGRSQGDESEPSSDGDGIVYTQRSEWWWCSATFAATFALLAYILIEFTPSTVPYCDSFTTALSIVGMWMLAHKRIEHWIVWIVVDAVSTILYIYKGLHPTAALYALYTVIAVAGYIKWLRMMRSQRS